jgi:photosystem II stability/assembly factor-like uncharacterized protein
MIREKGEGNDLYEILHVSNDQRLVTTTPMPDLTDAEYEIFRVHPSSRANWPIRLESLGGFLIYGTVDMEQPIEEKYISGPFYANIGRPNLGVFFGTDAEIDDVYIPIYAISVGYDGAMAGGYDEQRIKQLTPVVIAGDGGSVFARNWLGEDLWESTYTIGARARDTYIVPSGSRSNISHLSCDLATIEACTYDGEIITFDSDGENLGDNCFTQISYPVSGENTVTQPFGARGIYGKCGGYYLGESGLLGESDGTTHATGVTVALRGGISYQKGFTGTTYYCAVGDADGTDAVILTFTNPASITRETSGVSESFNDVAYSVHLDRLCAVGTNGLCMTSDDDGGTWVSRTIGTLGDLNAIVADRQGRMFCAVGAADYGYAQAWLSLDGITWEQVTPADLGTDDLVDVKFNDQDGSFYTVSGSGRVYKIRRRVNYDDPSIVKTFGTNSDYVCDFQNFDLSGTRFFFAVGSKIWSADNGLATITERLAAPDAPLYSVAFDTVGQTTLVAVGAEGTIYTSVDSGVTWVKQTSGVTVTLRQVIFHYSTGTSGDFIAVGDEGTVLRSADGLTWSKMGFPSTDDILSIASDGTNASLTQRNLYASSRTGRFYVNHKNADTYKGWELNPQDGAMWQSLDEIIGNSNWVYSYRESPYDRTLERFRHHWMYAMVAMKWPAPIRLVTFQYQKLYAIESLDPGTINATKLSAMAAGEYYVASATNPRWTSRSISGGINSFAIDDPESFSPTIVKRFTQGAIGVGHDSGMSQLQAMDGYSVSTDHGLTWSGVRLPNTLHWSCQQMSNIYPEYPWLRADEFFPICANDTAFYLVQSANRYSVLPRILVLDTPSIGYEVSEVPR